MMFIFVMLALSVTKMCAQWQEAQVPPAGASSLAVQGNTLFSAYYGLMRGNIYRSEDTGQTWHESDTGLDGATVISLYADDSILLAGTYNFGIFRSSDKGRTWHQTDSTWTYAAVNAIGSHGGYYFAEALENGGFASALTSTDGGLHWSNYRLASLAGQNGSLAVVDSVIFIGGVDGGTWYSSDDGKHWYPLTTGALDAYSMCSKDSFLFAATAYGSPLNRSSDNGRTWTDVSKGIPPAAMPYGFHTIISAEHSVFVSTTSGSNHGDHSYIFRSSNDGDTWDSLNDGEFTYEDLNALLVFGGYLFAGGPSVWRRPLSDFSAVATAAAPKPSFSTYPNPFSERTTINFSSTESGVSEVAVVNLLGAEVARLFSGELGAGSHEFSWDAKGMPAGLYMCIVRKNGILERIPIMLVK